MNTPPWMNTLAQAWRARASRERRLVLLGATVVTLYVLWTAVWQPSWHTLSQAAQQRAISSTQLQGLLQLQRQAQALRAQASPAPGERQAAATALAESRGAQTQPTPQGLRVTMQDWSPETLASYLAEIHDTLHLSPSGADLQQARGLWSGWLLLNTEPTP